jgi:hypothetical protein
MATEHHIIEIDRHPVVVQILSETRNPVAA